MNQVTLKNIGIIANNLRHFFTIGNIIILNGPMGSGKTTLLKAILHEYPVSSPSFLHALTYGEIFLHIDAYTIDKDNFFLLDLEGALLTKCVIIEWGNLVEEFIMSFYNKKIVLDLTLDQNIRFLSLEIKDGFHD